MEADTLRASRPHDPTPKSLNDLAASFSLTAPAADLTFTGITLASSLVRPGDIYVAVPGARFHGAQFVPEAIERGALAVITDAAGAEQLDSPHVPVLIAPVNPREVLGRMAAWTYDTDRDRPPMFGLTGTNGKTSTAHFLEAILTQLGLGVGLSSTAERRAGAEVFPSLLTTPESPEMHALLARMREVDVEAIVIEVSAHALTRHRVDGLMFDVAGFTNLSHDHLDDYASMDDYLAAKISLFQPDRARSAVVCLDTDAGQRVVDAAGIPVSTITSREDISADWFIDIGMESPAATEFTLSSERYGSLSTRVPLIGRHMAANAGLAIAMLVEGGFELEDIDSVLTRDDGILVSIPGRSNRVPVSHGPAVILDSGHSPDAFAKLLDAARRVTAGKVIMVAGANGNRDTSKRTEMGAVSARGSDILIITDHHPRDEDPANIRRALLDAARDAVPDGDIREAPDPADAIRVAVSAADADDTVVWAGLAGKDYREIAGEKIPFSVEAETRGALLEAGWLLDEKA
ncbi:Mur ligase family protein [Paramicrobacterium agarici]|uniref:UDP-N-acetylmuramyl-tripeptide synthetase n=1 Tax=Paramicrobacterium agarici TaxID=630514 RepID=A0A2A9DXU8_9MICO|nr:UDP-N-acetylmuramoyl-L-alanyl-D-glutamate--2,6-diaminopimelate ligase [Microbacterium agarici]PFG30955.1 UDP-N-acetylmuramoylalanyl-D-glutamate--2,6-diaminopimelate ligase [Microbacterium agarici]